MTFFTVLQFVKMFVWDLSVFNQYIYYCDLFCSGPSLLLRDRHPHRWVRYIDTTLITVIRFVWDCSFFTQYSYYCDFFCLGPALRLCGRHHHGWVRWVDTTKNTFWYMSLLLLSIDIRWFYYFIMFYFKMTNGAMEKWWVVKWCNSEIKIRIGSFFYHKYWICSFFYFQTQHFCSRQSNP